MEPTRPDPLCGLEPDDRRALFEQAVRLPFAEDEVLLAEGSPRQAIFQVVAGRVRVESSAVGEGVALALLGPGEVFGEMGFLEEAGASASVVGDVAGVVEVVEGEVVRWTLDQRPELAARFFRSLAVALARRLREANRRFGGRGGRAPGGSPDGPPPRLARALERLKDALLDVELGLRDGELGVGEGAARVGAALDGLAVALREAADAAGSLEGLERSVLREALPVLLRSATVERCQARGRGSWRDAPTLERLLRRAPRGSGRLGPLVDAWLLEGPLGELARTRARRLAQLAGTVERLLVLGAGWWPVLRGVLAARTSLHVALVDGDADPLADVAAEAREAGWGSRVSLVAARLPDLLRAPPGAQVGQEAVFTGHAADLLDAASLPDLARWARGLLAPGGRLLLPAAGPGAPSALLARIALDWPHREWEPGELRSLVAAGGFPLEAVAVTQARGGWFVEAGAPPPG